MSERGWSPAQYGRGGEVFREQVPGVVILEEEADKAGELEALEERGGLEPSDD